MKEEMIDTVALATRDVAAAIGHCQDKIDTLETAVTLAVVALAVVTFLAVRWGIKVYNARKNGIAIK